MKRTLSLALAVVLALSLAACGERDSSSTARLDPSSTASSFQAGNGEGIVQSGEPAPTYNLITGQSLAEGVEPGQRPVAIMINNLKAALPQRGIGSADAIFEMVTEGGITRFLAVFADRNAIPQVGPVRSARDQHLQFALPLNAIFVHIGSSVYAANLISEYSYQDIDGMYLGSSSFVFDEIRNKNAHYAQEHCWYTDSALIAAGIEKTGIVPGGANTPLFHFAEAAVAPTESDAPDISFRFSAYSPVRLTYDVAAGAYLKQAYDAPQIDESTGAQLAFQNVVLLFTDVSLKPDGQCTDFALTKGTGYYCYGGKSRAIRWEKGGPTAALKLLDEEGNEVSVNPGKSYIAVIGNDQKDSLNLGAAPVPGPEASSAASSAVS